MKVSDTGLTPESAIRLVNHITDEADGQCRLFHDIYMYLAMSKLHDALNKLSDEDANTFREAASLRGFNLNGEFLEQCRQACFELNDEACPRYIEALNEIRREQI